MHRSIRKYSLNRALGRVLETLPGSPYSAVSAYWSSHAASAPSYLRPAIQGASVHDPSRLLTGLVIALCATAASTIPSHSDASDSYGDGKKRLGFEESVQYLKQMLTPTRNRMRSSGVPSDQLPYLFVERDNDEVDDASEDEKPQLRGNQPQRSRTPRDGDFRIRLRVDSNSATGLSKWVALLKGPVSFKATRDAFSFASKDGSSEVRCEAHSGGQQRLLFIRRGGFTKQDLDGVVAAYPDLLGSNSTTNYTHQTGAPRGTIHAFGSPNEIFRMFGISPGGPLDAEGLDDGYSSGRAGSDPKKELEKLGITIYDSASNVCLTWDHLIGYEKVKRDIEDTVINYLKFPEVYEAMVKATRRFEDTSRPRALLFEGPPGTGKTLSARIVAGQCGKPMVHLPLESVVSKWYGDSEKRLSTILDACEAMGGCIIFIDEVDALAPSRGAGGPESSHEVSRRVLSVLLQRLEGFQGRSKNIIVCATNRKQDLDAALISRFNVIVRFDLPDLDTRSGLFSAYATHLSATDSKQLAALSAGLSCRGIKDVCEQTERVVASRIISKMRSQKVPSASMTKIPPGDLPTPEDYAIQLDKYKAGHHQGNERETNQTNKLFCNAQKT